MGWKAVADNAAGLLAGDWLPTHPGALQVSATVYVALLRGINVGGNNMVSMKALKEQFERLGFDDVRTYINSGNVLLRSPERDARKIEARIDRMLAQQFGLQGKTVVRSRAEMAILLKTIARTWTPDRDSRYYVIFLRHSIDSKQILEELTVKPDIEDVVYCPGTLLWSARLSALTHTAMNKLPARAIYKDMTVRNLNTTRKLFELMEQMTDEARRR